MSRVQVLCLVEILNLVVHSDGVRAQWIFESYLLVFLARGLGHKVVLGAVECDLGSIA